MDTLTDERTYTIHELSDDAREWALEQHRDWNVDHDWWDSVYEYAQDILGVCGVPCPTINFSGFWSQGDGACFSGSWQLTLVEPDGVREYFGVPVGPLREQQQEVEDLLAPLAQLQQDIGAFNEHLDVRADIRTGGMYCHEHTMRMNVEWYDLDESDLDELVAAAGNAIIARLDIEEIVTDAMRDLARWIYRQLKEKYEYLTSDEQVIEGLEANDMRFDEDGNTI